MSSRRRRISTALQPFVDNAISKTANLAADTPFETFAAIYDEAYDRGLKGCTVFRADAGGSLADAGSCPPCA